MDPQIVSQIVAVLGIAIATAVGLLLKGVAAVAVKYLEGKLGETKFSMLKQTVEILVKGIEQSPFAQEFDGARKKEMVLAQVAEFCAANNIPVDRELIDQMVEAAVLNMKTQIVPEEVG